MLVIDDEPSVADALRIILEDECFHVVVAGNGRDGIEQATRGNFSLIITDLRLPDMSGLDVLNALSVSGVRSAVILITSHGTPEIFAEARRRGVAGVLSKPFLPSEILQLVRETLAA